MAQNQTQNRGSNTGTGSTGGVTSNRKKRERKQSAERLAAELAYKNAKSDQEKAAARGHLKVIRFRDIVVPRVNKALAQLDSIAKLANRNAYTWSEEEAVRIAKALNEATHTVVQKFAGATQDRPKFTL